GDPEQVCPEAARALDAIHSLDAGQERPLHELVDLVGDLAPEKREDGREVTPDQLVAGRDLAVSPREQKVEILAPFTHLSQLTSCRLFPSAVRSAATSRGGARATSSMARTERRAR